MRFATILQRILARHMCVLRRLGTCLGDKPIKNQPKTLTFVKQTYTLWLVETRGNFPQYHANLGTRSPHSASSRRDMTFFTDPFFKVLYRRSGLWSLETIRSVVNDLFRKRTAQQKHMFERLEAQTGDRVPTEVDRCDPPPFRQTSGEFAGPRGRPFFPNNMMPQNALSYAQRS